MTDSQQFRADGHAVIDWAADYLEGIRERPVMSTVEPGEIRAALPASPPEEAEPFANVLADLDRVLHAGHHALEPPALLRLLLDHLARTRGSSPSCSRRR